MKLKLYKSTSLYGPNEPFMEVETDKVRFNAFGYITIDKEGLIFAWIEQCSLDGSDAYMINPNFHSRLGLTEPTYFRGVIIEDD